MLASSEEDGRRCGLGGNTGRWVGVGWVGRMRGGVKDVWTSE